MHKVPVNVEQAGAVRLFVNQMVVPELVVEGAGACHGSKSCCHAVVTRPLFNRFKKQGKVERRKVRLPAAHTRKGLAPRQAGRHHWIP
jgi:hypothetical protein